MTYIRPQTMNLLPRSSDEWSRFIYFPFRAFVLLAFIGFEVFHNPWTRNGYCPPFMPFVILAYMVCFAVFTFGGIVQLVGGRRRDAITNFGFAVLTFIVWYHSIRYLASA